MDTRIIFVALLLSAALSAWRWGGGPERLAAAMFVAAYVLSLLLVTPFAHRYDHVEFAVLCVDLCLLGGTTTVALFADRHWPMMVSATLAIEITAHTAKLADPHLFRLAYQLGLVPWSYVAVFVLLVGIVRHRRRVLGKTNWPSWLESSNRQLKTRSR